MKKYEVEGHVPSYLPEGYEWKLVWNDEFDGPELDESKWGFRLNFWGKRFPAFTTEGIRFDGNRVITDAIITVSYGSNVVNVAKAVQSVVRDVIQSTTGFEDSEVNVHVSGISFDR